MSLGQAGVELGAVLRLCVRTGLNQYQTAFNSQQTPTRSAAPAARGCQVASSGPSNISLSLSLSLSLRPPSYSVCGLMKERRCFVVLLVKTGTQHSVSAEGLCFVVMLVKTGTQHAVSAEGLCFPELVS